MTQDAESLLERDEALAELGRAVSDGLSGEAATAVILGGPGEGKTTLLAVACARAERDRAQIPHARGRVLRAHGRELEREFAYGVVRQLLEAPIRELDEAGRAEVFAGSASVARGVLGTSAEPPATEAAAVRHGLFWVLAGLAARGPLVLAVDDLHWVDAMSLAFIEYVSHRLAGLPVAILTATRPALAADTTIARILGSPDTRVVTVGPLGPASLETLVGRRLGAPDPAFTAACVRATGGNPFAVSELLGELERARQAPDATTAARVADLTPASITRNVLVRLGQLEAKPLEAVRALAVLGDGAPLRDVAALGEMPVQAAVEATEEAVRAGLLADGPELRFVHPLMRGGAYESIGAGRRAQMHARAASWLAEQGSDAELVAAHLARCEPAGSRENVGRLRAAARAALRRGAPSAAVGHLRRALAEPPDAAERRSVLIELGRAEWSAGDPSAPSHLVAARDASTEPGERVALALELAETQFYAGDRDAAIAGIADALDELGDLSPALSVQLRAQRTTILAALDGGWPETADAEHRAVIAELPDPGRRRAVEIATAFADAICGRVAAPELAAELERRIEAASEAEGSVALQSLSVGLFGLVFLDRLQEALGWGDRIIARAASRGAMRDLGVAHRIREFALLRAGALDEAEASVRLSLRLTREGLASFGGPLLHICHGDILLEQGRSDDAECALDAALGEHITRSLDCLYRVLRARLARSRGQIGSAIEILEALGESESARLFRNPVFLPWRSDLALLIAADQPARARELAVAELEDARRLELVRAAGVALRARAAAEAAEAAGGAGGAGSAEATLTEAVETLERTPARLELARALVDLGALMRRDGRRAEAREPLRRALDIAHRSGALPLVTRAGDELRAADGRPRHPRLTGVESLTPSELRVAHLAAAGNSNREVAQVLFIALKTVETHLSNVYRKLGIEGREGLAEAMAKSQGPSTQRSGPTTVAGAAAEP